MRLIHYEAMEDDEALSYRMIALAVVAKAFDDLRGKDKIHGKPVQMEKRYEAARDFLSGDSGKLGFWSGHAGLDAAAVTEAYEKEFLGSAVAV